MWFLLKNKTTQSGGSAELTSEFGKRTIIIVKTTMTIIKLFFCSLGVRNTNEKTIKRLV